MSEGAGGGGQRERARESGVALVEAAVGLVVVVALIGGISVVGQQWGSATRLDHLATRAVRVAARVADAPVSDLEVLAFVGTGLGPSTLDRLVVFRPVLPSGLPSPECAALRPRGTAPAGVPGWCTAFGPDHLAALAAGTASASGCGPESWEQAWCPAIRRPGNVAPGWVGVLVAVSDDRVLGSGGDAGPSAGEARAVAALDPAPRERP